LQRTELDNFHKKIFSLMGLKNPAKILLWNPVVDVFFN
jgi:hypothetical protein